MKQLKKPGKIMQLCTFSGFQYPLDLSRQTLRDAVNLIAVFRNKTHKAFLKKRGYVKLVHMKETDCKTCKRTERVSVIIPADLSRTHKERRKTIEIDYCIAGIVDALQKGGINMRGSCCGHGGRLGAIHLQDGRILLITNES